MQRRLTGSLVGIVAAVAIGALMVPIRSHIAIATAALVLIIPVVAGVTVGGWVAGLVSVVSGFVVYDFAFIPPYNTLTIGSADNWAALAVYAVVMTVVARLVSNLHDAEATATSRAETARHLLDLSELLLTESPALGSAVVTSIQEGFGIEGVTLLQSIDGRLEAVASAGVPISRDELTRLRPEAQLPVPLSTGAAHDPIQTLALASSGRPIGLLVLKNTPDSRAVREALPILANHLAIALERTALEQQAHHAEFLEEVDRLRRALVGAISHDLRTPLATIKVASSTLAGHGAAMPAAEVAELHDLIDQQTDRLTRLVNNLLDMTRIQSGALEVRRRPTLLTDLVAEVLAGLTSALGDRVVEVVAPTPLAPVDADPLLIGQVLANLVDNANRHAPPSTPITIEITTEGAELTVAVLDEGPGVARAEREAIFETFVRFDTGGRSGLGLAIAKAFVEAHGNRIWVDEAEGGGARFAFSLPLAPAGAEGSLR